MAAFNFPNSPSTNDIHTENGVSWKWNGTIWKRIGSAYTDATNLYVTGLSTFVGNAQFDANVSIGGTLTYEDVKNVDSVGVITARDDIKLTAAEGKLEATGATGLTLNASHGSAYARIRTAGSERLRIDSSGKMGLGTNNPNNPLTIHASGNHIYLKDTATNNVLQIRHASGVAEFNSYDLDGNARRDYVFNQYSSEVLRIKSDGKIGIGIDNPTGTLSIASGTWQSTTPESTGDDIVISGNQSLGIQFLTLASNTSNNNIYFGDTDDVDVGMIRYAHADNSMQFQTNAYERFRIQSDGIVTIKNNQPPTATLTDTPVQLVLRNATDHNWDGDEHCGAIIFRKGLSPNDNVVAAITATHTRAGSGMSNEDGGIQIWTTNNANPTVPALAWEFDHQGHFRGEDNHRIRLGDSNDLEIWHNGTTSIINDAGTGNLEIQTGGGARLEITTGEVRVKTGDLKIETDNKGIHFSGSSSTPDSNSTSNTRILTDYDEGTCDWELHRSDGLTTGSNNSSTRVTYTKIGNRVLMSGYVYTANTGSSTGVTARLTNASGGVAELPYTPNHSGGMPIIHTRTLDNEEYERMSVGFQANSKTVYVHTDEGNNSYTPDQDDVNINSSQTHLVLAFTGSYETSQ